jgi:hypothetical protein
MSPPYNPHGDLCLSIWAHAYGTDTFDFPLNARVLEIGCAEADWISPMLSLRPDLQITGIDWRGCKRPGTIIKGDVLTHAFAPGSFDCIVGVSSLEHIGLGHYESDPAYVDGDRTCLERIVEWLTPGGWVYFDVPYNAQGYEVHGTSHRTYDEAALRQRLLVPGLQEVQRWYATSSGTPVTKLEPKALPHYDYIAVLATKV